MYTFLLVMWVCCGVAASMQHCFRAAGPSCTRSSKVTLCVDGAMTHGELFAHGAAAMGEGRIEEARRLFTQALEADPTHGPTKAIVAKFGALAVEESSQVEAAELKETVHEFDGGISVRVLADSRKARRTIGSLWASAPCLVDWLAKDSARIEQYARGKRVIELGAGLGLVGTALSKLGATHVTMTDLPQQLPLLRQNLAANFAREECDEESDEGRREEEEEDVGDGGRGVYRGGAVVATALPWGAERLPPPHAEQRFDLIVATDVTYDAELVPPLAKTIFALLHANEGAGALLALPHRSEFEPPVLGGNDGTAVRPDWELLTNLLTSRELSSAEAGEYGDAALDLRSEHLATIPSSPHAIDIVRVFADGD